jgi:hypothetical protein
MVPKSVNGTEKCQWYRKVSMVPKSVNGTKDVSMVLPKRVRGTKTMFRVPK